MPPLTDHFAIAVGIDTYPSLRPLRSSVSDATQFLEWVTDPDGGNVPNSDTNVRLIRSPDSIAADPFDARPVQSEIDKALRDFGAAGGQRVGTRLYFYFAGHGFGPTFDNVGMLMASASMDMLKANIGLRDYRDYLHERGLFDEVIYIIDCCRDNARGEPTGAPIFNAPVPVANKAAKIADFVVLAAGYGEKAFAPVSQIDGERRGILTKAILEALRGDPKALDANGRVTAASVQVYLKERVKAIATDAKLGQEPEMPQDLNPNIVFRVVPQATIKKLKVQIISAPALTGELIIRDARDLTQIVAREPVAHATEAAPWEIELQPNTRYEVENPDSDRTMILDPAKAKAEPYVWRF
jgi:uncharacterized caspase-like protein